jgi:hypothetical protein
MNLIRKYKELELYFRNADHIDVKTIESDVDLRCFISGMLSYYPLWMVSIEWPSPAVSQDVNIEVSA